jgi:hypothetical protein
MDIHKEKALKADVLPLFHRLWGKAVGTSEYDKKEWQELERLIQKLFNA